MQQLHEDFWNFRGVFRIARLIDIGTQISLVQRRNGRFLVLDSYTLEGADREALMRLTNGGRLIDAVLNLHPFHTLHVEAMHRLLPEAKLYGTQRHKATAPQLPWQAGLIEAAETQALFVDDLEFTVPAGIDFISADPTVHTSSVLVRHKVSRIVHVDDTLTLLKPPGFLAKILPRPHLRFHPMLSKALRRERGAADAFAGWANNLAQGWADTEVICAAHSDVRRLSTGEWERGVNAALNAAAKTLNAHKARFG